MIYLLLAPIALMADLAVTLLGGLLGLANWAIRRAIEAGRGDLRFDGEGRYVGPTEE